MTLKDLFLLDPEVVFLNHGSFGACPKPVFQAYQEWQRRLEWQPVKFMREVDGFETEARQALAAYLGAGAGELAFVPNATHGVNIVARSLHLAAGDEILTSNHEYGACDNAWNFACGKTGADYVHRPVRLPAADPEEMAAEFWQGVTPHTRLIYLSHITSPTALRLPVEAICRLARQAGILTFIDGAHAPGQIPLDLGALGADFYTGNCHKWMMAPKGAGFLYARAEVQHLVEPLIVSRPFYNDGEIPNSGSPMVAYFQYTGTRDIAAYLAVPDAIRFMDEHQWDAVRLECHAMLRGTLERISALTGLPPAYPHHSGFYNQMAVAPLPTETDLLKLREFLYNKFKIEIPLIQWNGQKFARISVQGYNTSSDLDTLVKALETYLS